MLRARLHLLSHKESLVLSGKQKKINFLIFIDRCGHGAKAALGVYAGPIWSQSAMGSSLFSALLQWEAATSHPQSHQSQLQGGLSCGNSSPEPQKTPLLYKTMGFIQIFLLFLALRAFFVAISSTMSKQHFSHLIQLNSISMSQIHPKLSLHHTNGPGGYGCRGWNSTAPA